MADDLRRIERLLRVQREIRKRADWQLARASAASASLSADRQRLLTALSEADAAHADLIVTLAATRLTRLDVSIATAAKTEAEAAQAARAETGRADALERRHRTLARREADQAERRTLMDIGEAAAGRTDDSLG
ncbi:hypothetical protein [Chthonobacter rhizosphaerae]|uniref:hypothetical protein n=1 Tax=Chthonobacter rhizosphaerae TaxID=2735553 RepID=UPI0015EF02B4|nr:hypothetical protein [Chthonobacter rhizosphaerae]